MMKLTFWFEAFNFIYFILVILFPFLILINIKA